jgi:hypothetical protein
MQPWTSAALAICTLVSACGDGAAQAPRPVSANEAAAALQAIAAAGGHVSTGSARSSVNAASPTQCNAPGTQFVEARVGKVSDAERGGSVCLNRSRGWDKWISASVKLPPGLAAAS